MTKSIYCCGCKQKVAARLTDGAEIYPHRPDLARLPFWKCDHCGNYVGCHYKTSSPTNPLGNIPTPEVRAARKYIHAALDPIWKSGIISRRQIYKKISEKVGWEYHTSKLRTVEESRAVYRMIKKIEKELRA